MFSPTARNVVFLLVFRYVYTDSKENTDVSYVSFCEDVDCEIFSQQIDRGILIEGVRSKVHCAQIGSVTAGCLSFWVFIDDDDKVKCHLAGHAPMPQSTSPMVEIDGSCYQLEIKQAAQASDAPPCMKDSANPDCYVDDNTDLHRSTWQVMPSDFKIPAGDPFVYAKSVFVDDSTQLTLALSNTQFRIRNNEIITGLAYDMQKNASGFEQEASRISYVVRHGGSLCKVSVLPNGKSKVMTTIISNLKMYSQGYQEYTINISPTSGGVKKLIAELENGYKIKETSYAKVGDKGTAVSTYAINRRVLLRGADIDMPVTFNQLMYVFPHMKYTAMKIIGTPGLLTDIKDKTLKDFSLSPLWRPAYDFALDSSQRVAILTRLMSQGHKFRVAINGSYFDIDVVMQLDDMMYFMLPQQVNTAPGQAFTPETLGLRAILSLDGVQSGCEHGFESEGSRAHYSSSGFHVRPFVDMKFRDAELSIYSNGTVAFGSVANVTKAVKDGKDVSMLMEWLNFNKIMQFTVISVTIKDYGHPNALALAESDISWSISLSPQNLVEIDSKCNMVKILAKSNGEVEVLTYNVHIRQPLVTLADVRSTWFTY